MPPDPHRPDAPPDAASPTAPPADDAACTVFLACLDADAQAAARAETSFRQEIADRTAALAEARAHAFRRADLMRALAETVEGADSREMAVAGGQALLRGRLGWTQDSAARVEVLEAFAAVCLAVFAAARPQAPADEGAVPPPAAALAAFEEWYAGSRETPFWHLFEHYMPETPLVDF